MKISIQGYQGSFHHIVAKYFFGDDILLNERNTFKEVFLDVVNNNVDFGIVAIENSIAGSIYENYDHFLKYNVFIIKEIYLRIQQNLITLPETNIDDIQEIHSHIMAIRQCEDFLNKYPQWKIVETADTALSVKYIHDTKSKNIGAIASTLSAELYGMKILQSSIETNKNNYTRFFVISNKDIFDIDADKSSIVCELEHRPGSLANLLNIFKEKNINLTKIESRPIVGDIWKYYFYIDVESNIIDILNELHQYCKMLKLIGVYKKGIYI